MSSRNSRFRERGLSGALWAPIATSLHWALVLLGLLLAAWCVDALFVFRVWPEGIRQLEALLSQDLEWAQKLSGETGWVLALGQRFANGLYAVVFETSGIHKMALRFSDPDALSIPDTIARSSYIAWYDTIRITMLGTQRFGVRLAILVSAVSLAMLVYGLAMADGLVARAIRRARGGHESSSLYHRCKHMQLVLIATAVSIHLVLPTTFDPRWLWWTVMPPFALLVRMQWLYYKKHA